MFKLYMFKDSQLSCSPFRNLRYSTDSNTGRQLRVHPSQLSTRMRTNSATGRESQPIIRGVEEAALRIRIRGSAEMQTIIQTVRWEWYRPNIYQTLAMHNAARSSPILKQYFTFAVAGRGRAVAWRGVPGRFEGDGTQVDHGVNKQTGGRSGLSSCPSRPPSHTAWLSGLVSE